MPALPSTTSSTSARRRSLRRAAVVVGLAALVGVSACSSDPAQVNVAAPLDRGPDALPDGVTVEAVGEMEGAPDTMGIDFGVSVKRPTVQEAIDEAAVKATAMLEAAKANGVDEKDIQTRNYTVQQDFTYPNNGAPVPDGFRVSNVVHIDIRDLDKAGATIDAATTAGGNDTVVQSVSFSLDDDAAALDAARADAMTKAKAKAEQLAEAGGGTLGPVQAISDVSVETSKFTQVGNAIDAAAYDEGRASTPISPGEVTSSVTVRVRFTLA